MRNGDMLGAMLARAADALPDAEVQPDATSCRLWKGEVSAVTPGGAYGVASVKLDGVNPTDGIPYLVQPSISDVVFVLEQGPVRLILGKAAV